MLLLTSDEFADWFGALSDQDSEDVATALDLIETLGPLEAPPGSRESLLWYEHPSVSQFQRADSPAWDLEAWGSFRDYTMQVLASLESPRLASRLTKVEPRDAAAFVTVVRRIRTLADPRLRWTLKLAGHPRLAARVRPETACDDIRRLYFEALAALGFDAVDVPAHSSALREFSRRMPAPAFRLLYGVDVARARALVVVGEWLGRSFYGDSVRRAERMWKQFLGGDLHAAEMR